MSKKQISLTRKHNSLLLVLVVVAVAIVFGVGGYYLRSSEVNAYKDPSGNTAGYVIARQAEGQVKNFYRQYIKEYNNSKFLLRDVQGYGSDNLAFYNSYYQHGFNPITCSSLAPVAVNISKTTPGTVATVYADLEYSDHSTSTVKATVVINNDGIKIDSITCPGDKGNLPPEA